MAAFSERVLEHYHTPRNRGTLTCPSGSGLAGCRETGQFMRVQVTLAGERIQAARFQTVGCVSAIASGSFLTEWATGKSPQEALQMTGARLERELGGLPPGKRWCAELAVEALRVALQEARQRVGPRP